MIVRLSVLFKFWNFVLLMIFYNFHLLSQATKEYYTPKEVHQESTRPCPSCRLAQPLPNKQLDTEHPTHLISSSREHAK